MRLAERLKQYVGQPVACLCARYWYRGVLKEVGDDHIVMINPRAIEVTGPANGTVPEREDPIPGDLMIRIDFIEIVCQPSWVYHEMSESDVEKAASTGKPAAKKKR